MATNIPRPQDIYQQPSDGNFYSPFNLRVDPMKRLLLINFQRDPDTVYVGFEPQIFDDPINGRGLMVIAWRNDGWVDIYHQPTITQAHKNYDIVGNGLADLVEVPFEGARYEVGPHGVDVRFAFEDKLGRPIAVYIRENHRQPRRPFSLLAPFPSGSEKSPSLPLALLYDFYFVRRAGTEVEIVIDGQLHRADTLPVPIDRSRMYFMRYSTDPYILHWNDAFAGTLPALQPRGAGAVEDQGAIYDLSQNGDHFEISGMRPKDNGHVVRFAFNPPFPDVVNLQDGAHLEGTFHIDLEKSMGSMDGVYQVQRNSDQVKVEVHPSGGWQPGVRKWTVRLMFFIVKLFKNWPKTYHWTATLDLSQPGAPQLDSRWSRRP